MLDGKCTVGGSKCSSVAGEIGLRGSCGDWEDAEGLVDGRLRGQRLRSPFPPAPQRLAVCMPYICTPTCRTHDHRKPLARQVEAPHFASPAHYLLAKSPAPGLESKMAFLWDAWDAARTVGEYGMDCLDNYLKGR